MDDEQREGMCPNCGMSYQSQDHLLFCGEQTSNVSTRCGYGED